MKKLLLVGILHGLLCPLALMAQTVTITFTGVASNAFNGYNVNDPVFFSFVLNDNAPTGAVTNAGLNFSWFEGRYSASLYNTISGTDISGTFVKPTSDLTYSSGIEASGTNSLTVQAQYTGAYNTTGISANDNSIYRMYFYGQLGGGLNWGTLSEVNPSLYTYLSNYGDSDGISYAASSASLEVATDTGGTSNFTINSVSITTTAVPEPSTYAALVGLLALGFVAVRRRRRG